MLLYSLPRPMFAKEIQGLPGSMDRKFGNYYSQRFTNKAYTKKTRNLWCHRGMQKLVSSETEHFMDTVTKHVDGRVGNDNSFEQALQVATNELYPSSLMEEEVEEEENYRWSHHSPFSANADGDEDDGIGNIFSSKD